MGGGLDLADQDIDSWIEVQYSSSDCCGGCEAVTSGDTVTWQCIWGCNDSIEMSASRGVLYWRVALVHSQLCNHVLIQGVLVTWEIHNVCWGGPLGELIYSREVVGCTICAGIQYFQYSLLSARQCSRFRIHL